MRQILITCCGACIVEHLCGHDSCKGWATLPPCEDHDPKRIHIVPLDDMVQYSRTGLWEPIEHARTGLRCPCDPMYAQPNDNSGLTAVFHRAFDGRPGWEQNEYCGGEPRRRKTDRPRSFTPRLYE